MSILDTFSLQGKTALVTGCKRGIGKAMAVGLAEAGADIIAVSATLEPEGSEVEKEVTALGRKFQGYAASKGGIGQLTMALANEWASKGVNVNAIAPGYIRTDNTQALQDDAVRSEQILTRIPAGRWGAPDDFKGPVVFLASDASRYMSGHVMLVDGGWMGRWRFAMLAGARNAWQHTGWRKTAERNSP